MLKFNYKKLIRSIAPNACGTQLSGAIDPNDAASPTLAAADETLDLTALRSGRCDRPDSLAFGSIGDDVPVIRRSGG